MSSEPIDIEVRDKINSAVRDKLLNLAQAALEGANSVDKLNAQLEKINGSSLNKLVEAQKQQEAQTLRNSAAYLQQETALNKAVAAEAKAATSVQTLAAAQAKAQSAAVVGAAQQAEATQRLAIAAAQAETAQIRAAAASTKSAAAAQQASNALNAFGESEAEVAARLSGVANAGANLAKQQQALGITAVEAANSERTLATQTKLAGGAATDAASRYSNYMSALNTVKKNSTLPPNAGIPDVAKIDKATESTNKFAGANAGVTRELIVLGHEAVTGNFSRIPGSLLVLAERTNGFGGALQLLGNIFTSLPGLIGLAIVSLIAYAAALIKVQEEQAHFNDIAKLTGNIAGLTLDAYNDLTVGIAAANKVSISSAKDVVSQLSESGRFQQDQIVQFADSAIKLSKITKQSTDEIVKDFIKAGDAPLAYARKLQETTNIISPLQLEEIKRLDEMGRTSEASRVLSKDLYDYLQNNAPQALTGLSSVWNTLSTSIVNAGTYLKNFIRISGGGQTSQEKLDETARSITVLQKALSALNAIGAGGTGAAKALQDQIDIKQDSIDKAQELAQSVQNDVKAQSDSIASSRIAEQAVDALGTAYKGAKGNVVLMNEELDKFRHNLDVALNNPATKNLKTTIDSLDNQAAIEASIRRKYAPAKVPATPDESRAVIFAKATAELQKQLLAYGDIKDVRDALLKIDQLDIQLATHTKDGKLAPLKALTEADKAQLTVDLQRIESNKRVEASQDAIYQNIQGPQQKLQDGQIAINNLLDKNRITADKAAEAQRALNFAYDSATNPLFQFNKEMKQQNDLLESNLDAKQRAAKTAVNQINNQLAPQGKSLSQDKANEVEKLVLAQQHLNEVTQAYDQIISQGEGAADKLTVQQEALNKAFDNGKISLENYSVQMTQLAVAKAQLNLDRGIGDATADLGLASIGKLLDGYKNLLSGLSTSFGDFFKSLEDGFADATAHALVFGGSLSDALLDVARNAVQQLLSSLIKLGIQWVIQQALGTEATSTRVAGIAAETTAYAAGKASQAAAAIASLATVTAANVAAGVVVAEAWAAAATLVSLASYGANAIPATEGISATFALTTALAAFKEGGYTGDGGLNDPAGIVHGQEFVVNAAGTAANRGTLEAMNRGDSVGSRQPKITIEDHTTGGITWEQKPGLSVDDVRIIARNEVNQHAPNATAAAMQDPNSKMSKSVTKNFRVQREHA